MVIGYAELLVAIIVALASLYCASTRDDGKALFSAGVAMVAASLIIVMRGYTELGAVQFALAVGFLSIAGFLAPQLGSRTRGQAPETGVIGGIIVFLVLLSIALKQQDAHLVLTREPNNALLYALAPVAASLLVVRRVVRTINELKR